MNNIPIAATNTIEELQKRCEQLEQQNAAKLKWFEEQHRLSLHQRFGSSSEQTVPGQQQLFNEAEAEAKPDLTEPGKLS
ncbi:MAG: transposase, partial [Firmicutes bacterium]|nr:transposase [Bacillota bacterium]